MKDFGIRFITGVLTILCFSLTYAGNDSPAPEGPGELAGIWRAKRNFGPEIRGLLTISQYNGKWLAEIAGVSTVPRVENDHVVLNLPNDQGSFIGKFDSDRAHIIGHWIQPITVSNGNRFASPVQLQKNGPNRWRGTVTPLNDEMTIHLVVRQKEDGNMSAFLRNPERNIGVFLNMEQLLREGNKIILKGHFFRTDRELTLNGSYDSDSDVLTLYIPSAGGSYDFIRTNDADPDFYPNGKYPASYVYRKPSAENDGWPVASLEEVGISFEQIQTLIDKINRNPIESVHASDIHAVLIARHGKLVLEEYFHGFHRNLTHDTRSASKSLSSTLVGAAIQNGAPITVSSPVLSLLNGSHYKNGTDLKKQKITVENLMTMSSGLDCDDADGSSPGNEDTMQQQSEEPDWYRYTLSLKMVRDPGEKAVYCSGGSNLMGAVVQKATGKTLPEFFYESLAEPMQVGEYHMNLTPTGDAYMGGGVRWLPRDFMKLGQLLLNDGIWNGRRLLPEGWARRATSPLYEMREVKYGYAWWIKTYPYHDGTVNVFYAAGNGGQYVMVAPELDLVVAFYGGNYNDAPLYIPRDDYLPNYVLPAIRKE